MCKNIEARVDLVSIEVRNDQGSSLPMKRCELTKVERTKVRVSFFLSAYTSLHQTGFGIQVQKGVS